MKGEAIVYDALINEVFIMPWGFWIEHLTSYPRFELLGEL